MIIQTNQNSTKEVKTPLVHVLRSDNSWDRSSVGISVKYLENGKAGKGILTYYSLFLFAFFGLILGK